MDWSLLHTLNDFLFHHDQVEDPLLFYVNVSEALFVATLAIVFLISHGPRHLGMRRATVAAVLSAGLGLLVAKVISELVDRARPVRRRSSRRPPFLGPRRGPWLPQRPCDGRLRNRNGDPAPQSASRNPRPDRRRRAFDRPGGSGRALPSDVLAGAAVGAAAALALWTPAARRRVDAIADFLGRGLDRALGWASDRTGIAWRPSEKRTGGLTLVGVAASLAAICASSCRCPTGTST